MVSRERGERKKVFRIWKPDVLHLHVSSPELSLYTPERGSHYISELTNFPDVLTTYYYMLTLTFPTFGLQLTAHTDLGILFTIYKIC